jgi:hypothetical protein
MYWTYAYTPYIWPPVLTGLLMILLATYTWRQRQPGQREQSHDQDHCDGQQDREGGQGAGQQRLGVKRNL